MSESMKLFTHIEIPYEETTDDYTTTCLWCGSDKLSVSKTEGHVFQCWSCKQTGNAITFMRKFYEQMGSLTPPQARQYVSKKKGVIPSVLASEGVKFDAGYFWFPVRNIKGDIIALHKYNPQNNIAYASPKPWSCSVLGLNQLTSSSEVWVAEGHADYLVARGLLKNVTDAPSLLGTCGSGFSGSYLHVLEGKKVVLLFDNDEAGKQGVSSVARRIKSSGHNVASLHFLDWSLITLPEQSTVPDKFDLRDLVNAYKG